MTRADRYESMISAQEALERLRKGNARFVSDVRSHETLSSQARRNEVAAGQEPFAIILGCSDSRVPAEIVFDQGLGDLFVIRVAGNIVASSQVGSVEFAAARLGTRLVIVLGHTQCGAILATLEELQQPTGSQSRHLRSIVDHISGSSDVSPVPDTSKQSIPSSGVDVLRRMARASTASPDCSIASERCAMAIGSGLHAPSWMSGYGLIPYPSSREKSERY